VLFVSLLPTDRRKKGVDIRVLAAVMSSAWARTRSEATRAALRSWRMNVNRLVIVVQCVVDMGLDVESCIYQ